MDHRQEARDTFDRVMRVPDKILVAVGFISMGTFGLLVMETIGPAGSGYSREFMVFYAVAAAGVGAFSALYFAFRFIAALSVAALAVRRGRESANGHHAAGRPVDKSDAPVQTVHQLVAGR